MTLFDTLGIDYRNNCEECGSYNLYTNKKGEIYCDDCKTIQDDDED